jgi:hypothetical protein
VRSDSEPAFHDEGPGPGACAGAAPKLARRLPGPAGGPGGYYYLPPRLLVASGRVALTVTVPPGCGHWQSAGVEREPLKSESAGTEGAGRVGGRPGASPASGVHWHTVTVRLVPLAVAPQPPRLRARPAVSLGSCQWPGGDSNFVQTSR